MTTRVQVRDGAKPSEDRIITLTRHRLFATDLFVVGVVDGTGRLTDPRSLLATTEESRARRHANRLYEQWGGETVEPDYSRLLPGSKRGYKVGAFTRSAVEQPRPARRGGWVVWWEVAGESRRRSKRFQAEQQARSYYAQLTAEMENQS